MDNNYTVVETSKVAAVRGGGHLYSLISDEDVQNGSIGYVGNVATDEDGGMESLEIHEFEAPSAENIGKQRVVLVANPEWDYDETRKSNQAMYRYVNQAGTAFRAYDLTAHDVFALSKEGFNTGAADAGTGKTPDPEIGKYVIAEAGKTTLKVVEESAATGESFYGRIIGSAQRGLGWTTKNGRMYGHPYTVYFVEVLRNDIASA